MPRRRRFDAPGRRHHVVNRATGKRPFFELADDHAFMCLLLEEAVGAGRIIVEAFCLMGTHFHLLLVSVDGRISRTMQWLQSKYVARFNINRDRPGALVQGRFWSQPVRSLIYLLVLVRYLDLNPVKAGICSDPLAYPYGSAIHHVAESSPLEWLSRALIDDLLAPALGQGTGRVDAYRRTFGLDEDLPGAGRLVETRLAHPSRDEDRADDLLCAHGGKWLDWIRRRALEADGTAVGLPMADARSIVSVVAHRRSAAPLASLSAPRGQARNLWDVVETGLLRDVGGLTYSKIAQELGIGLSTAKRRHQVHRGAILEDEIYREVVAEIAVDALTHCFGPVIRTAVDHIAGGLLGEGRWNLV